MQKRLLWLLVLLPAAVYSYGQQTTAVVTGIVKSENGDALPGVTVKAADKAGTFNSTVSTNTRGIFTFSAVPVGGPYSFIVSSLGYISDTLNGYMAKENGRITLSVVLKEKLQNLDNIVVVGYGKTSKANITGAVTSVQAEDFNQGVFSSPAQLLQGKVAGLNITKSGNPNENPGVILRGPSSFRAGAQEPFYVIDGVPGASLYLVAPDDIVSIDVLKDASSTAIYGSRAANGVIMITTRKAKPGQARLAYSSYVAFESISKTINMATGDQLRAFVEKQTPVLDFKNPAINLDQTEYDADDASNTNWQKEVTRTGVSHNHNLSYSGSSGNSDYGASVNYLNNQGIIRNSSMDRMIIRGNIGHRAFNDRLKLSLNITNSNTTNNDIPSQVYNNMLTYLPVTGVRNANGTFKEDVTRTPGAMGYYNPASLIENNLIQNKTQLFLVNGTVKVNILKGLDFNTLLSMQKEQVNYNSYYNSQSMLAQGKNGAATRTAVTNTKKVLESYLDYDRSFGEHHVKLLAGYSFQEDKLGDGFGASNQGFLTDDLTWNNLGLGDNSELVNFGDIYIKSLRLISFYGRLNYEYKGKYLLQASMRRDGSSAFGRNNRWGMFPAVSAGWNLHREAFLQNARFLNQLKLRAGYGVSGNTAGFDPNISLLLYRSGTGEKFYYNGQFVNSVRTSQNENPNLKWERTSMVNVGLDFALFRNILSGSIDVYEKRTSDLIGSYDVSTTIYSYGSYVANVGKMSNKGIELVLNANVIKKGSFSWTTSVNVAHNVNKVLSISNDMFSAARFYAAADIIARSQSSVSGYQVIEAGHALGSFYTRRYAGKDTKGMSLFYGKDGSVSGSNDNWENFDYTGSAQPKILYGWNNSFSYKGFDLNFFLRGVAGNRILNATWAYMSNPTLANNTNIPVETLSESAADTKNSFISDRFIESGSFLRLDNATLGYSFQTKAAYRFRLYVSGNNIFTVTDYRGMDPEVNMSGQTPGIDNSNFYPKTRSFLVGVNMVF
ncbi:SusC/RagA family TonB-linked outer membrane protein [Filimonas effusa]|uniref:SusC/RagA family TonB-linked outer membrane protein n=2 Tax=Filimonas effusa TaxID=2508721 RepID=A0A4Q1D7A8_9BACT|nr:SusC/RagA family TonB-linked outer membrane protein [Filimonas effusa]